MSVTEAELRGWRAYFEIEDEDLARLGRLRPIVEKRGAEIVDAFYHFLLQHSVTKTFLFDSETINRLKKTQHEYFLGLFAGRCDLAYVEDRLRVGRAHERIGLPMKSYIGAYRKYEALLSDLLFGESGDASHVTSLRKLVALDMALATDTYVEARELAIRRHQTAIHELSTPVIELHDRVLLLPLVGAVDSHRAAQILERVLDRVAVAHPKVIIIDIAGVPVMDTLVANTLVRLTRAVKLLGATTILTGVGREVAKTIIRLGIDVSSMQTESRLSEGLAVALALVGKAIEAH